MDLLKICLFRFSETEISEFLCKALKQKQTNKKQQTTNFKNISLISTNQTPIEALMIIQQRNPNLGLKNTHMKVLKQRLKPQIPNMAEFWSIALSITSNTEK